MSLFLTFCYNPDTIFILHDKAFSFCFFVLLLQGSDWMVKGCCHKVRETAWAGSQRTKNISEGLGGGCSRTNVVFHPTLQAKKILYKSLWGNLLYRKVQKAFSGSSECKMGLTYNPHHAVKVSNWILLPHVQWAIVAFHSQWSLFTTLRRGYLIKWNNLTEPLPYMFPMITSVWIYIPKINDFCLISQPFQWTTMLLLLFL